jgi:hypothetical protein
MPKSSLEIKQIIDMFFLTNEKELVINKDTIIFFYSPDKTNPTIEMTFDMLNKLDDTFNIMCIDVSFYKKMCKRFDIKEIPTILFFSDGKETKRIVGVPDTSEFDSEKIMSIYRECGYKQSTGETIMTNETQTSTVADQIWSEIKDKDILMFALPGQKVSDHCTLVTIDPSRCFLIPKASAFLPALESAIGNDYECSVADKYVVVARKPKSIF